ncbi:MAG: ABC transporter substrate-binding protein [Clostridia bacterium]|jgi:peptide/nickel transport system substrate-binding protein
MRKALLIIISCILIGMTVLTGCGTNDGKQPTQTPEVSQEPEQTSEPTETPETPEGELVYKDAPMLKDRDLPPVEERLPKEPKISNEMPPDLLNAQIGQYGGTLRSARMDVEYDNVLFIACNEPLLNTPGLLGQEVTPNVLKGFEVSDDQKEFTFYMREGLKWSDGQPVTTEDVAFAVEDVQFNDELSPAGVPNWLRSEGKPTGTPMKFEVIDEYTFKISFDKPYGGFLLSMAIEGWRGYTDLLKPKHYLKDYHKKYNTDSADLEAKIADAGFQPGEWVNLFSLKDILNNEVMNPQAIGFPTLSPWIETKSGDIIVMERNPYYFKVDAAGNQLPYMDYLESTLVQDLEMVNMKLLSGELDHSYEWALMSKVPMYKESEAKAGTKTMVNTKLHRTAVTAFLNLTYDDPTWREVVHDVRFRKALNLAMDKAEVADTVYYGYAQPADVTDPKQDVEEANRLLDEMGMTKDAEGFRVGPDGKRFSLPIEYAPNSTDNAPVTELLVDYWKQLNLDVNSKQIDAQLQASRNAANELQVTEAWVPGLVMWFRAEWNTQTWAPLWDSWWKSNGKNGEEPPADIKAFYGLLDNIRTLPLEEARKNYENMLQNLGENVWFLPITKDVIQPVVVNAKLQNFEDKGFAIANNFAAEQWFYSE